MKRNFIQKLTKVGLVALLLVTSLTVQAQETVNQVQPSIIVMPFTKGGENALDLYENDFKWQSIVARINNAFQERGFRPKDLQETIFQVKKKFALDNFKNATINPEEEIYAQARPDIVVKAIINIHQENGANRVQISLKAVEISSRVSLYDLPTASSPPFQSTDYGYIVDKILTYERSEEGKSQGSRIEKFINGLNTALKEVADKGKVITVDFITDENCLCRLDDEIGEDADFVSELITKWVQDNAFKNQYKIKNDTENILSFEEVRIPLRTDDGRNYSANDFARALSRALYKICKRKEDFTGKRPKPQVSEGTIRIILP